MDDSPRRRSRLHACETIRPQSLQTRYKLAERRPETIFGASDPEVLKTAIYEDFGNKVRLIPDEEHDLRTGRHSGRQPC